MKKIFKNKNNIIIGLCGILLLMGIGFAAFSQRLNITGTSSSDNNWNVYISDVNVNSKSEKAEGSGQITSRDSASFITNLSSPGDYVIYNITVKNDGNVDAILEQINLNKSNNLSVILYETNGIEENDNLYAGDTKTFTLKVSYDSTQTGTLSNSQKTNSLTLTLDFVQKNNTDGSISLAKTTTIGGNEVTIKKSGSGLYESEYEEGRYIYRGASPNNYLTLGGESYRIISKETDGTLKVIKSEKVDSMAFDTQNARYSTDSSDYCNSSNGCKVWGSKTTMLDSTENNVTTMPRQIGSTEYNLPDAEATLNTYLNTTWYNNLTSSVQNAITTHLFNVGLVSYSETNIATTLSTEKAYKWSGKVGLANVSDYVLATTNENCTTGVKGHYNNSTCYSTNSTDNWLYKDIMKNANYPWLSAPHSDSGSHAVWYVSPGAGRLNYSSAYISQGAVPVLYLKSDLSLEGTGSSSDPFQLRK